MVDNFTYLGMNIAKSESDKAEVQRETTVVNRVYHGILYCSLLELVIYRKMLKVYKIIKSGIDSTGIKPVL